MEPEREAAGRASAHLAALAGEARSLVEGGARAQAAARRLAEELASLSEAIAAAVDGEAEVPAYGAGTDRPSSATLPALVFAGDPPPGRLCYDPARREFALRVAGATIRGAVGDVVSDRAAKRAAGRSPAPRVAECARADCGCPRWHDPALRPRGGPSPRDFFAEDAVYCPAPPAGRRWAGAARVGAGPALDADLELLSAPSARLYVRRAFHDFLVALAVARRLDPEGGRASPPSAPVPPDLGEDGSE